MWSGAERDGRWFKTGGESGSGGAGGGLRQLGCHLEGGTRSLGEVGNSSKSRHGEWVQVSRKRKWVSGGNRGGAGGVMGRIRCYRCLGMGHRALECREPPTCWSCGKRGHRSSGCRSADKSEAMEVGGREGNQGSLAPVTKVSSTGQTQEVHIPWSPSLEGREERFNRSVLLTWRGEQRVIWEEVEEATLQRWPGIPPFRCWPLGVNNAIIRLPSLSLKDIFIREEQLDLTTGQIIFGDCSLAVGGLEAEGQKVELILRGIPLLWRSEEVMRRVAQTWGHLMEVKEVVEEEPFFVIRMGVWRNAQTPIAPSLVMNLDGWKVRILVEVVGSGVRRSFAEVAKSALGGGKDGRCRPSDACGSGAVKVRTRRSESGEVGRPNSVELVSGEEDQKRKGVVGGQSVSGVLFHEKGNQTPVLKIKRKVRELSISAGVGAPPVTLVRSDGVHRLLAPAILDQPSLDGQVMTRVVKEKVRVLKHVVVGGHVEKSQVGRCQEEVLDDRQVASKGNCFPVGVARCYSGPHSDYILRRPDLGWAPYFGKFAHGSSDPVRQTSSGPTDPGIEPDRVSGGTWPYFMQEDGVVRWKWSPYPMQGRGIMVCESCDSSVGETGQVIAGAGR
ncbi:hypothetical protein QJS10_CPA05g01439 [Acorus calamus]|uniref:CCHC-type domain-containing protein n=1 Tax=Acorus calamus TaxID=4465 RepID=A0AAV9ESX2_ACOCL|nr:hypothetical protein QJS10_CPA05g01439 [Acorus calamus]